MVNNDVEIPPRSSGPQISSTEKRQTKAGSLLLETLRMNRRRQMRVIIRELLTPEKAINNILDCGRQGAGNCANK